MKPHYGKRPFCFETLTKSTIQLTSPLEFHPGCVLGVVEVPRGFVCRVPGNRARWRAEVVRQWLYRTGVISTRYGNEQLSRYVADLIYSEALEACDVGDVRHCFLSLYTELFRGGEWARWRQQDVVSDV